MLDSSPLLFINLTAAAILAEEETPTTEEITSIVGRLCTVMLTAEWSWRENALYYMNITLQRGEVKNRNENQRRINTKTRLSSVWWKFASLVVITGHQMKCHTTLS